MQGGLVHPRVESGTDTVSQLVRALQEPFVADDLQDGQGRRAPYWRAAVGTAQAAGLDGLHDRLTADHGRQGEAAGQGFGQGDEVRLHS